jgi:hypothetical protein
MESYLFCPMVIFKTKEFAFAVNVIGIAPYPQI